MMVNSARDRAKRRNLDFSITKDDFDIPEVCPILGCPLEVGTGGPQWNSPTLDKWNPSKGYVPGNVWVISHRANNMKTDASKEELLLFRDWIDKTHG